MLFGFEVIDQNNNYSADRKNDGAACSRFFYNADDGIYCRKCNDADMVSRPALDMCCGWGLNPEPAGGGQARRRLTSVEPGPAGSVTG